MKKDQSNLLSEIANNLADNLKIDWRKADSLQENEQALLKHLNTISQVAQLHRSQQHKSQSNQNRKTQNLKKIPLFKWGRFSVLDKIGEGAFGQVYRAYDSLLDRNVALKLLKTETNSSAKSGHFIEEAKRLAKVRHPHVLAIHGANIHDGRAGFWADIINGQTMKQVGQSKIFSFKELITITHQVSQGLDAIHHAGIIHGDIKPANIMQDERGDCIIMDFGAGIEFTELESLTGYIHGTPALMAPELFSQKHEGTASDIYSFGATLFKLATGKYPIEEDNLLAIQQSHKKQNYSSLKDYRSDLPKDFINLVQSMLSFNAKHRPNTQGILKKLYDIESAPQRRKNKIAMWSIIGLLIAGTAFSTFGFYQANQAKKQALAAQNKAETVNSYLQNMLEASSELGGGRDVRVADVLDQASNKLLKEPPKDLQITHEMHLSLANSYNALKEKNKSLEHAQNGLRLANKLYPLDSEEFVKTQLIL